MLRLLSFCLACLATAAFAAPVVKTEHVEADLIAEAHTAQPGKPAVVGLRLRMAPEWHTYWKNPGDSGLPTRIQWVLPEGWKAGEIQWPYPKPLPIGPLMNYGYEDEVVLLAELTPPPQAVRGPVPIKARAEWLVCKDVCIPEKGELDLTLALDAAEPAANARNQVAFQRSRAMLPAQAPGWKFDSAMTGKTLTVRITPPEGVKAPTKFRFFPEHENLIVTAAPQKVVRDGTAVRIEMPLAEPLVTGLATIAGIAVADGGWSGVERRHAIAVAAPVAVLPALAVAPSTEGVGASLPVALVFAFLGGVLLNLMPCVFPVLGIKVMGFVQHAHGDARAMKLQGIVFGIGVVLSFLVLAGVMLALRAGGTQLGWGFQLQSPAFVTLLAALFFVLALNLSGVFEWGAFAQSMTSDLSARGRYADAFLAGVLATVVATPCTAPFMGAAVGYTLAQGAAVALAVFAMLGIGMAVPVVLLAAFPSLLRRLPRPGAWMETFKQVLAFPLYATVAWLVWVVGAQAGNDAVLMLLGGLVLIALGAWIYGRWSHSGSLWRPGVAIALGALGLFLAWPGADALAPRGESPLKPVAGELAWQSWSPEKVRDLGAQGIPVFVDFTAAWCVTCQVNKRVALNNSRVVQAFAQRGVVPLKADWTRQDPRITEALAALGRNAVPVYALYIPGAPAPTLLPEVLTPALVLEALSKLPSAKPAANITQR